MKAVIKATNKRKWAKANPDKVAALLAQESKLPLPVANSNSIQIALS